MNDGGMSVAPSGQAQLVRVIICVSVAGFVGLVVPLVAKDKSWAMKALCITFVVLGLLVKA